MTELYNKKNKEQLINDLNSEQFNRITLSFYRYVKLENLLDLRNVLYEEWKKLDVLGRIYIAEEGINAQISVPEHNFNLFTNHLNAYSYF